MAPRHRVTTLQEYQERVWSRIDAGPPWDCWPWTGGLNPDGYGQVSINGRMRTAHDVVWEWTHGPIPDGLQIDHRCHTAALGCPGGPSCPHRRCCNPAHLEPVTALENQLRGMAARGRLDVCPYGHVYAEVGVYISGPDATHPGKRQCRACSLEAQRRYRERKKEAAA